MSKMVIGRIPLSLVIAGIFVLLMSLTVSAEEKEKNRIEINATYEYLTPNDVYGDWKSLSLSYYRTPREDFTFFIQVEGFTRKKEGDGILGVLGVYKDWTDWLYTYTSVSAGSNSSYLPEFRADHDFNFKLGEKKNVVWIAGATYIKYYDVHKDLILSTGLALYYPEDWIWEYRLFRADSDPGNKISYSHLFSIGYGREKWQWTHLDISTGKQAYLATYVEMPESVENDTFRIALRNRLWLGKDYGMMVELSYLNLHTQYENYGVSLGFFKEF